MLIDSLLEPGQLRPVFQPIVDVTGDGPRLYGLECLMRGAKGTHFEAPNVMFEYVRFKAAEARVDRACIATALAAAAGFRSAPHLSVNVHAATLSRDPEFPEALLRILAATGMHPTRLTVEITEHGAPWVTTSFHHSLIRLRREGISIALDDVGIGHSNFKMMVDVHPDVLKLDRLFVHGVHSDGYRQAIVESVLRFAMRVNAHVVAEGVSDERDLAMVRSLGVGLVQGFIFARPAPVEELATHALLAESGTTANQPGRNS